MELFVDDIPVGSDAVDQMSLAQAMRQIQSTVCEPGHLVVGLRCDGQEIPSNQMVAALEEPVSRFERIEVFTAKRTSLVEEAMGQAAAALDDTGATCERAAELLNQGKAAEGIEALGKALEIWHQVHEAVSKSIDMLGIDPDATSIDGAPLAEVIGKPAEVLVQIRDALTARDYVLLTDVLQYELSGMTEQWQSIVLRLQQEAQGVDDGAPRPAASDEPSGG